MTTPDAPLHTRGKARFIADLPEPRGLLHAIPCASPTPHAEIRRIDASPATRVPGVISILTAADIPGENQIGGIVPDEPLLADGSVHFVGQPVVLVVAETASAARRGAAAMVIEYEDLEPVFDPRQAAAQGQLIAPSRTIESGDPEGIWSNCALVVQGRAESGGQEHLYLETQAAMALPEDGGRVKILSSTQAPTAVQRIAARVLALPMHAVEVDVERLGGAFGGKEDQATPWAVLAALAATRLGQPVKLVLSRHEDMRWTGKRHPYSSDFKIGLDADGRILAYEVTLFQNAGAAADLSTAVLERSMFHATNAYSVPNVRITAHSCRTHLPPFTAFRGFGGPQAMFVMESAIAAAAEAMDVSPRQIQRLNLLNEGDTFPYGMSVTGCHAGRSFDEVCRSAHIGELEAEIEEHNNRHRGSKRGLAVMPVCFGISFTSTFLNQAAALVHIYTDGSVGLSTGAVEMGQGVNSKLRNIAALTLGIPVDRVRVETTNTTRVANTSPTAASTGADMNGRAVQLACRSLLDRLQAVAAEELDTEIADTEIRDARVIRSGLETDLEWERLVWQAYARRVSLTAQAHYATPGLAYNRDEEQGDPFAYHVFGAAVIEVTVDCLRGTYNIDQVRIAHDGGRSLDPIVDRGQIEGGLVQGLGWMTMEELLYRDGHLVTDNLTTYKVPDIHSVPRIDAVFLDDVDNSAAVLSSKAIGEPPFMYGIGVYFALLDAMTACRTDRPRFFAAPMTPEKVLLFLHGDRGDLRPPSEQTAAKIETAHSTGT